MEAITILDLMLIGISGKKPRKIEKPKIDEFESNSQMNNIIYLYRALNDFKKSYQPRNNREKE
jgi:hypothetical protein